MFRKKKKYKLTQETRPDIYHKNIWLSKRSYDAVKAIAEMEKTTLKDAVESLIQSGVELYINTENTFEKLKRAANAKAAREAQKESEATIEFFRRIQKVFGKKDGEKTDE